MTVSKARGAKAKADKLFSLIVRSRGACECCGGRANLQTAHIISRRYSHTRCDLRNAFCLDAKCHRYFTDYPIDFAAFVEEHLGSAYDDLRRQSQQRTKVDWHEVAARLAVRWKEIEAAA